MISAPKTFFLLIIASLFRHSLSVDTRIQVDLILPRNNTIYQPVYPFPIVFAVHNFSAAWQYEPLLEWRLYEQGPGKPSQTFAGRGSIGWDERQPSWSPPPDKLLAINFTESTSHTNESSWFLEYGFTVGEDVCLAKGGPPARIASHGIYGIIYFNTSYITGEMPGITASGSCHSH